MELKEAIEHLRKIADIIPGYCRSEAFDVVIKAAEKQIRSESMNIKPTTKFLNNTPERQLNHMTEEMGEIAKALRNGDIENAREEIADLQLSCETLMCILGGNGEEERDKAIQKNRERGYYNAK